MEEPSSSEAQSTDTSTGDLPRACHVCCRIFKFQDSSILTSIPSIPPFVSWQPVASNFANDACLSRAGYYNSNCAGCSRGQVNCIKCQLSLVLKMLQAMNQTGPQNRMVGSHAQDQDSQTANDSSASGLAGAISTYKTMVSKKFASSRQIYESPYNVHTCSNTINCPLAVERAQLAIHRIMA